MTDYVQRVYNNVKRNYPRNTKNWGHSQWTLHKQHFSKVSWSLCQLGFTHFCENCSPNIMKSLLRKSLFCFHKSSTCTSPWLNYSWSEQNLTYRPSFKLHDQLAQYLNVYAVVRVSVDSELHSKPQGNQNSPNRRTKPNQRAQESISPLRLLTKRTEDGMAWSEVRKRTAQARPNSRQVACGESKTNTAVIENIGSCLAVCVYRRYDARDKLGEHERSVRVARGLILLLHSQTKLRAKRILIN